MPSLNKLIYDKIIKYTDLLQNNQANSQTTVHVQNMSGLNMLQFKVNYVLSRIKHNS